MPAGSGLHLYLRSCSDVQSQGGVPRLTASMPTCGGVVADDAPHLTKITVPVMQRIADIDDREPHKPQHIRQPHRISRPHVRQQCKLRIFFDRTEQGGTYAATGLRADQSRT